MLTTATAAPRPPLPLPSSPMERARQLAARFAEGAAALDASGAFPHDNFTALFASGLTNLVTAREHGGTGAGLGEALAVIGEIARGEPSTALILSMHYVNHAGIRDGGRWPRAAADAVIASGFKGPALINALQVEPEAGSPSYGALPRSTARRTADGWRLTGRKRYATGCEGLHWLVVSALTDEAVPRQGSFVISRDAPGIRIERVWNTLGMRATGSHDVVFEDVPIADGYTLDLAPLAAERRGPPRHHAWFMTLIGAVYHGIAHAARNDVVAFARSHQPGGLATPIAALPLIQDQLGEIEILLEVGDRLLRSVAAEIDAGGDPSAAAPQIRHQVIENAVRIADVALRVAGNAGIHRDNAMERHYRNALCGRTHAPNGYLIRAAAAKAAVA